MTNRIIPLDLDYNYDFDITLEETKYNLSFNYNGHNLAWYMDILSKSEDVDIDIRGIKLVGGVDLFSSYPVDNFLGSLYVVDLTGKNTDPTDTNINDTHQLVYVTRG